MLKKMIDLFVVFCLICVTSTMQGAACARRGTLTSTVPLVTGAPKGQRMQLQVSVSGDAFKPVGLEDKQAVKEFIPRAEQLDNATQKIILRNGSVASGLASKVLSEIKLNADIREENATSVGAYTITKLIVRRTNNNRSELVAVYFYTGPTAFGGVQYSISLDAMSEQEALKTVENFITNNVSVVNY